MHVWSFISKCVQKETKKLFEGGVKTSPIPRKLLKTLRNVRSEAESEKLKILRQIIGERAEEHSLTKIKKIKNKHLQKSESEVYRNFKDRDDWRYKLESS